MQRATLELAGSPTSNRCGAVRFRGLVRQRRHAKPKKRAQ
ncbi:hypothetical protein SAMN05216388_1002123 [Halorientalis persicus]|uniref:Uncharacterized protein n=1 Tax=Halorientalis persicus TaxID=1367881 RepID=A0A1H8EXH4_9EURY|nr:hypothetical protein SAMN05216388_1002123 [Halorientalis persicus]